MKRITDTEAFAELASARDGIGEITERLYAFYAKAKSDETPEGRVLSHIVREVQLQLNDAQKQLADMAACYH